SCPKGSSSVAHHEGWLLSCCSAHLPTPLRGWECAALIQLSASSAPAYNSYAHQAQVWNTVSLTIKRIERIKRSDEVVFQFDQYMRIKRIKRTCQAFLQVRGIPPWRIVLLYWSQGIQEDLISEPPLLLWLELLDTNYVPVLNQHF